MAGGIFITQNKIRPGFYHKFTAAVRAKKLFGDLGVAALPLELDWGGGDEMISIDSDAGEAEFLRKIGQKKSEVIAVREVLKRARKLLFYRVNGKGEAAELDMAPQPVAAIARYAGVRGNDISVAIEEDETNVGAYVVKTYVDAILRDEQRGVLDAQDITDNDWVLFTGIGVITAAAGGALSGGSNSVPAIDAYAAFLKLLESYECNAFGAMCTDADVQQLFIQAAKKRIEEQGQLSQCILPGGSDNYEAVTSLKNGVILLDGTVLDATAAVAWYVGAASAAGPAQSLTYTAYDDALEPDVRLSDEEIKAALQQGQIVFVAQYNESGDPIAVVEQDINTLTRYTQDRPQPWSKNRVVRALYYLVNSLTRVWHLYYIGKVDNNETGRGLFKADLTSMMRTLVEQGAFENFDAETDIIIQKGETSDAVVAQLAVQPVDAMEKMYFTVEVQ